MLLTAVEKAKIPPRMDQRDKSKEVDFGSAIISMFNRIYRIFNNII